MKPLRMRRAIVLACAALLGSSTLLLAKDQKRLKDALQDDLVSDAWIYEDVEAGYTEANKSGKPLLVSFRCVP